MLFMGIDAGQTHLEVVLIDKEGKVVARGLGGPSHIQGKPMFEVFENAFTQAMNQIPNELYKIQSIGAGLTGIGIPGKREAVTLVLHRYFPKVMISLDNDAVVSFWGSTCGKDGATLLAGTGSIAYGKYNGKISRLGGFGYLLGDEGGGAWIGLTALRRVLKSEEGREFPTSLTTKFQDFFSLEHIRKLPGFIYASPSVPIEKIAQLTTIVADEAKLGDSMAIEILEHAGLELAKLLINLLEELKIPRTESFPVYTLGGVWKCGKTLTDALSNYVQDTYSNIVWAAAFGNPAVGAALMGKACLNKNT